MIQEKKTPSNISYRTVHMATLKQQIKNNKKNYDANISFQRTGQPSPVIDNRTIQQQYEDIEMQKIRIRQALKEITDEEQITLFMQNITQPKLEFLIRNLPGYMREIKKTYPEGALATLMMNFLEDYMDKLDNLENQDAILALLQTIDDVRYELSRRVDEEELNVGMRWKEYKIENSGMVDADGDPIYILQSRTGVEASFEDYMRFFRQYETNVDLFANALIGRHQPMGVLPGGPGGPPVAQPPAGYFRGAPVAPPQQPAQGMWANIRGLFGGTGIGPDERYKQLGRYYINTKRLNGGFISIRRKTGTQVATLPTTKISQEYQRVLKNIIGGNLPKADDILRLEEAEQDHIYKLADQCCLLDKLDIPTIKRNKEDQDMIDFNIMKGQIIAGNDSKDLIKRFKKILLKLGHQKKLNMNEVKSVLLELAFLE